MTHNTGFHCPKCIEPMFKLGCSDLFLWPHYWNTGLKRFWSYLRWRHPKRTTFVAAIYVCAVCGHQSPTIDTSVSSDRLFGEILNIRKGINYSVSRG